MKNPYPCGAEVFSPDCFMSQLLRGLCQIVFCGVGHISSVFDAVCLSILSLSEAIHLILKEAKSMVREQQESILHSIYECSVTSGSILLPKLVEVCLKSLILLLLRHIVDKQALCCV
jgi:hypothetical protein